MRFFCLFLGSFLAAASIASAQEAAADLEEQAVREAVARVAPSVVRIETLGGREKVEQLLVSEGPTTGVVVSEDGYIVSSSFNFVHEPASILVTTPEGKRAAAKIVARDKARMLVLLKIEVDEKLAVPVIAPRGEMQVGQYAISVGRTLSEKEPNISVGVLSALQRIWGRAIQTDAKVSPANYGGPLIDIQGRVLGVLTPLMPQGEGEIAGVQWYDSGIGFAAPLDDWLPRLETLKAGQDLAAGVMGIALKPGDIYALPAEISVCQINAPAYRAGLRAGDKIVEADGTKIERQVQLRHVLGKHYAGDQVQLVALRGKERVEATIELVDHLDPYEYPMLGILPMRGTSDQGIEVRFVFPESPAAKAGIAAGDRLIQAGGAAVTTVEALQNTIAAHDPEKPLAVEFQRGDEKRTVEIKLAPLTSDIPSELPPAVAEKLPEEAAKLELGLIDIKLPEEKQDCFAYVPSSYHSAVPHGLVVWFAPPGQFDRNEVEKRWKDVAEKYRLIVISPRPAEAGRWHPGEIAVVRKFIDNVTSRYNVDRTRIVLHGRGVGGTMAWFTALANRNLVRGVVPMDSPLPSRATVENDPVNRLFVFSVSSKSAPNLEAIDAGNTRLNTAKVPLNTKTIDEDRELNADELDEVARWIDSLDRV
jgi:serine protease Do